MYHPFFPSTEFAWTFILLLGAILVVAAYVDWRRMVIPKWLTMSLLVTGVIASITRVAWLATREDASLWLFQTGNPLLGGLDGLCFALFGLVISFAMLFLLWILGTCGGGDVKLFAALGTWIGPVYPIFVLLGSLIVLFVQVLFKLVGLGFSVSALRQMANKNRQPLGGRNKSPGKWRITYSFPIAVATLAVLIWSFRDELRLAEKPPKTRGVAHAR